MNNKKSYNNESIDSDDNDDYRPPIPSKIQNLKYGNFEPFEEYKKKIIENDEYDEDMKQVL